MNKRDKWLMFALLLLIYANVRPQIYFMAWVGTVICVVLAFINWND